jgi:hypothetical protein
MKFLPLSANFLEPPGIYEGETTKSTTDRRRAVCLSDDKATFHLEGVVSSPVLSFARERFARNRFAEPSANFIPLHPLRG